MERNTYIRFDWAIKRLLRDKANLGVLEGLLTVLFNDKTQIVEILESEGNQQRQDDKFNRVDIKAKNSQGETIMVEVQNIRLLHYLERILYGTNQTLMEHISLNGTFLEVKKVYFINILYFDLGKGNDYLYHGQNQFIGVHTNDKLLITAKEEGAIVQKLPEEVFPEYYLIRVNEFNQVAKTPLEEWIQYLKTGDISPDTTAPGLLEAREKLRYYDMSQAERHEYDEHINAIMIQNDVLSTAKLEGLEEGRIEGRAEGRAEDRVEGRAKERLQNAKAMKQEGIAVSVIAKITGLSIEEIEKF